MKKVFIAILVILLAVPVCIWLYLKTPVFGAHPERADFVRFEKSLAFNAAIGEFENRQPELIRQMREANSTVELLTKWFEERPGGRPERRLPQEIPNVGAFLSDSDSARLIWLGHSTFLLNLAGTIILVDPVFSDNAAPVSFTGKRFQDPAISLDDLPPVDIVLLSHDHYDHLDYRTILRLADSSAHFMTPLGVGLHLRRWGIENARITELDWWESHETSGVEFTALPAQHFSGRDGINNNQTLWASWAIITPKTRLYFSGDSGYDIHFAQIGERLGPFDLSIMENGQYDPAWPPVHVTPEEAVQAHLDLRATRLFPVHWGMFELAFHSWYDPAVRISAAADLNGVKLFTPMLGQVTAIDDAVKTSRWWEPLLP